MRSYFMPAIAIAMIMPATARSDDIPNLDVRPILSRNCESVRLTRLLQTLRLAHLAPFPDS
jgi:hypothetical protein